MNLTCLFFSWVKHIRNESPVPSVANSSDYFASLVCLMHLRQDRVILQEEAIKTRMEGQIILT